MRPPGFVKGFVKRRQEQHRPTAKEIREGFQSPNPASDALYSQSPHLLAHSELRGTRPYWVGHRRDLQAMVKQLDPAQISHAISCESP
ncbi:hypothetical protein N7535_000953 [Penicillium sp. DV-2018c]|nr:hypothetical protein N7535_000953 [Penicillium sp. DV-2018c]